MKEPATCPRCQVFLTPQQGAWLEDVCPSCQGRLLSPEASSRLFLEYLGIKREVCAEIVSAAPRRLQCPACRSRMSLALIRGVDVDLCGGCGAAWLDKGELLRLGGGRIDEVESTHPILTPVTASPATNRVTSSDSRLPPAPQ
jgi:Zn-finger nucleic acid-binding protein